MFIPIKNSLKRDLKKWEEIKKKRSKAGKKSAQIRANKKEQESTNLTSVEKTSTNPTVNVSDSVTVSVSDSVTVNNSSFKKEPKDKLTRENKFRLDANKFEDQYSLEMIESFCDYWTESKTNGKKMLFEMQKTFDISRRLKTWNKRNISNGNKNRFTIIPKTPPNRIERFTGGQYNGDWSE